MAADIITVKHGPEDVGSHLKIVIADYHFGSSYTTGGDAVTPAMFGLAQIHSISDLDTTTTTGSLGFVTMYDKVAGKLLLLQSAGTAAPLADVGTSDQSAVTRRVLVIGY